MTARTALAALAVTICIPWSASAQSLLGARADPDLTGPWLPVGGTHCGRDLTPEELAQIAFAAGPGGYGIVLTPVIPEGNWATSFFCHVHAESRQLSISRNIGFKGIKYWGLYEVSGDTLRIGFALTPWERITGDSSYTLRAPRAFAMENDEPSGLSTVIIFRRLKQ